MAQDFEDISPTAQLIASAINQLGPAAALAITKQGPEAIAKGTAMGMAAQEQQQSAIDRLIEARKAAAKEKKKEETDVAKAMLEAEQNKQKMALEERKVKAQEAESAAKVAEIKKGKPVEGKIIASEMANRLADHDSALAMLDDLEKTISESGSKMGPVAGRVSKLMPYDVSAQALNAKALSAAQNIGKSLEGGKLTDSDILRYQKMLPQITDDPTVAQAKLEQVRTMINSRKASEIQNYQKAGYNVGSFEIPQQKQTAQVQNSRDINYGKLLGGNEAIAAPSYEQMSDEELMKLYQARMGK